jgi:hypothetical protein
LCQGQRIRVVVVVVVVLVAVVVVVVLVVVLLSKVIVAGSQVSFVTPKKVTKVTKRDDLS